MKITVRGKNMEITSALREYVEKRLNKLEKYSEYLQDGNATLSVTKDRHRIEVTIPVNGWLLRGEEETEDMYSSVDNVVEKLEKQIDKYKTKISKKIKAETIREIPGGSEGNTYHYDDPQIVRTKRFAMKPMSLEEAVMQMNLLGHNFFVFSNAETDEVNVVYMRNDGNYGHIEPEY